jgi:hypothetical protein
VVILEGVTAFKKRSNVENAYGRGIDAEFTHHIITNNVKIHWQVVIHFSANK